MRLAKLYVRTAVLTLLAVAACACHTAQKPVSLLPPAKAPALKPTVPPVQVPTTAAASSPAQVEDNSSQKSDRTESAPASAAASTSNSDPVADLIARAEKEYQAGLANHQAGKTEEAKQNFDTAKQDELLAQAHALIVDDAVLVWVVHDTNPHALSPRIKKFVQAQHWFQDLTTIGVE